MKFYFGGFTVKQPIKNLEQATTTCNASMLEAAITFIVEVLR